MMLLQCLILSWAYFVYRSTWKILFDATTFSLSIGLCNKSTASQLQKQAKQKSGSKEQHKNSNFVWCMSRANIFWDCQNRNHASIYQTEIQPSYTLFAAGIKRWLIRFYRALSSAHTFIACLVTFCFLFYIFFYIFFRKSISSALICMRCFWILMSLLQLKIKDNNDDATMNIEHIAVLKVTESLHTILAH